MTALFAGICLMAATPPLPTDIAPEAVTDARAACKNNDFDSFLVHLASAPPAAQRAFFGRTVKMTVVDRRKQNAKRESVRRISGHRFTAFPLVMVNHHFVYAQGGKPAADDGGVPQFVRVTHERQTATLTDYPVSIVNVSWEKIHYGTPIEGRHEGEIVGSYGDSGRLLFANGRNNCWELIDSYTTLQSDVVRPTSIKD
ncbi:MAG: hypothetical protein ACOVQ0_05340 [Novosphingobium sp.]|uniref:hypothetical protein n=1 Tax=Novosphingobium sp. TaxID=1874826 RepID=UPI003B9C19E4